MNKDEARRIIREELAQLEGLTYAVAVGRIGEHSVRELRSAEGNLYRVETRFSWDDEQGGDVRVSVSVDDGGWRSYFPLTEGLSIRKQA